MNIKIALRILGSMAIAAAFVAVPYEAAAAIAQTAGAAMEWAGEIAIVGAVVGALVLIDMTSWSLMTNK